MEKEEERDSEGGAKIENRTKAKDDDEVGAARRDTLDPSPRSPP